MSDVAGFLTRPWGRVTVSGPDGTSFLQALVSQDLGAVADGGSVPCLLLHPQGKLDVAFRAHRVDGGWWCTTEPTAATRLAASLTRFRIRVQADIVDATADTARAEVVAFTGPVPGGLPGCPDGCVTAADVRPGWTSTEIVGPVAPVQAWLAATGTVVGDDGRREALRIAAGLPRQDVDLDDSVIPQEAFLERDAVSFTKGCFLGQELVCRIDARGHVNRFLRRLAPSGPVAVGDEIRFDDRTVGAVTSAAERDDGWVALGWVRREVVPPATVEVVTDGGPVPTVVAVGPDSDE